MKLSTRGRYAVTALLDMAENYHQAPVSLQAISVRQNISLSYLEQLFLQLRRARIVTSVRGANGGYRFAMEPNKIMVYDIMQATHESFKSTQCNRHSMTGCRSATQGKCRTHHLWAGLENVIESYLKNVTLGQLMGLTPLNRSISGPIYVSAHTSFTSLVEPSSTMATGC